MQVLIVVSASISVPSRRPYRSSFKINGIWIGFAVFQVAVVRCQMWYVKCWHYVRTKFVVRCKATIAIAIAIVIIALVELYTFTSQREIACLFLFRNLSFILFHNIYAVQNLH